MHTLEIQGENSRLPHNLMADNLATARGFALADPHRHPSQNISSIALAHRINDVLCFDPLDPTSREDERRPVKPGGEHSREATPTQFY